ncbi:class A sortase [Enterococcus alcedinis]|uniref:Class A sortase n=1 Tax=Enterococcus alcedinis TaxID=1274384 RepID=A0A917JI19_9ENTE|nr:class A sortase [Enterococcus alcedinis]MBP2102856.1 sortase A [Enterococcus alcedinis]GGI66482.1 class A sortase [Enterococcus alcedinis]
MRRKKWKNRLINSLLFLLFIVGIALIFNQPIKNFLLGRSKEHYQVATISREQVEEGLAQKATFDFDQVQPVDLDAVIRAQLSGKILPVIGGVAIPSIEVQLPIFKGLDNDALLFGAGTFDPEQKMGEGNYALASHRIEETTILFTRLDEVQLDETVYLTDMENIYTYNVTVSKRIEPTEVEVLDEVEGKKMVTLITCGERAGVTRWLVQGELTDVTSVKTADKEMLAAFSMEQKTF